MKDHDLANKQDYRAICRHHDTAKTLASVIIHPADRKMEIIAGNPCQGTYQTYRLYPKVHRLENQAA